MAGPKTAPTLLETVLRDLTREADPALVAPLEEKDWLQCFACGHRCKIGPGRSGVCRVRFNEGGKLRVPFGYVGALQVDPIEKKPFFHVLPGSTALSFGMLGCDFHCAYCFLPGTRVLTERGDWRIEELFGIGLGEQGEARAAPSWLRVATHTGAWRKVTRLFRHRHEGKVLAIRPEGLPVVEATPEHPFLAVVPATDRAPIPDAEFIPAKDLSVRHLLALPRRLEDGVDPEALFPPPMGSSVLGRSRPSVPSGILETSSFYLLPIREIRTRPYRGPVYNLEVEGENSYLVNGVAVHNCQNWITSQAIRDPNALADAQVVSAEELVNLAFRHRCPVVTSTYNEPLITSEWAAAVFREAKRRGLLTSYVSNGNATEEVLRFIRPHTDLYKVDLKSFRDSEYRKLGGKLETVTWTICRLVEMGFWVEIVTLIVPGLNDSPQELRDTARFLASVSADIPWHVTAFHPDYKMMDRDATSARKLLEAYEIGREEGMRYVYAGNLPGRVGNTESTFCPDCGSCLVERSGYRILGNRLQDGACPDCGAAIPGVWKLGKKNPLPIRKGPV